MSEPEKTYFLKLKKAVSDAFLERFPAAPYSISNWKGQDIVDFQEDLRERTGGTLSEKWFYTHLKNDSDKLPRIDMLNMLSKYAGHHDWNAFVASAGPVPPILQGKLKKGFAWYAAIIGPTLLVFASIYFLVTMDRDKAYKFCFISADTETLLEDAQLDIILLRENESPVLLKGDSTGCFEVTTAQEMVRFVVRSPYYKTDTITRYFDRSRNNELIKLRTNDYALMIHFFSASKVKDWKKRRRQLSEIIHDDARIIQVYPGNNAALEIYNKQEFINKLTMPLKSLQTIEVIETKDRNGKIAELRFVQQPKTAANE